MAEVKLKPCPFCGGEAKFIHKRTTCNIKLGYIKCMECGARMELENCTEDFARDTWNRRAEA